MTQSGPPKELRMQSLPASVQALACCKAGEKTAAAMTGKHFPSAGHRNSGVKSGASRIDPLLTGSVA